MEWVLIKPGISYTVLQNNADTVICIYYKNA